VRYSIGIDGGPLGSGIVGGDWSTVIESRSTSASSWPLSPCALRSTPSAKVAGVLAGPSGVFNTFNASSKVNCFPSSRNFSKRLASRNSTSFGAGRARESVGGRVRGHRIDPQQAGFDQKTAAPLTNDRPRRGAVVSILILTDQGIAPLVVEIGGDDCVDVLRLGFGP
jgi:hypothetical protein